MPRLTTTMYALGVTIQSPSERDLREIILNEDNKIWDTSSDLSLLISRTNDEGVITTLLLYVYGNFKFEILYSKGSSFDDSYIADNGTDDSKVYVIYPSDSPVTAFGKNLFNKQIAFDTALHFLNTGKKTNAINWVDIRDYLMPDPTPYE